MIKLQTMMREYKFSILSSLLATTFFLLFFFSKSRFHKDEVLLIPPSLVAAIPPPSFPPSLNRNALDSPHIIHRYNFSLEDDFEAILPPPEQETRGALQRLRLILDQSTSYPIIIGGIGDSGTRGVREILQHMGVNMLPRRFTNAQGDSEIFQQFFLVYSETYKNWAQVSAHDFYVQGIRNSRKFSFSNDSFSPQAWEWGNEFIGAMAEKSHSRSMATGSSLWGFKHPRTMLLLPFFISALGNRMKFIHVLRDPKEIVTGRNQKIYKDNCNRYYGKDHFCGRSLQQKFQFWADTNREVFSFAQTYLSNESYLLVRTEDFVLGQESCFTRLANFAGVVDAFNMSETMLSSTTHVNSYFGIEMTSARKKLIYTALMDQVKERPSPFVRYNLLESIAYFGYSLDSFDLSFSCHQLPLVSNAAAVG